MSETKRGAGAGGSQAEGDSAAARRHSRQDERIRHSGAPTAADADRAGPAAPGGRQGRPDDGATAPHPPKAIQRTPPRRGMPRARNARLRISKADPWSVMMTSLLMSLGLGLGLIVTVFAAWITLNAADPDQWPSFSWGLALAVVIVVLVEAALATALATLAAFIYNWSSVCAGGVELTMEEDAAAPTERDSRAPPVDDVGSGHGPLSD
ncbi:DUF3566 domain-containing protein [Streptomyces sp. NPDC047009]|uniref:DUF3566 domain-containing protein n=1 Tax=Streptomyces sp. NPDC047009 TaxID=3154496 RepID=UPI0033E7EA00